MWLLRYTRYCICDTVPPCRAHVHMLTLIQFLRARKNIHTILEACFLYPWKQWARNNYWPIPRFVCNIKALIPWDLCFYTAYKLVNNYYTNTVVSRVSAHRRLNTTRDFGPYGRLPGIKISCVCMETATLTPWNGVHGHGRLPRTLQ